MSMGHKQFDFESIPKYGQKSGFELKKLEPEQPFVPSFTIHQPNNHQTCGTVGFRSWDRIIITTTTTTSFFWSCSLHDLLASCSRIPSLIILSKYVFFFVEFSDVHKLFCIAWIWKKGQSPRQQPLLCSWRHLRKRIWWWEISTTSRTIQSGGKVAKPQVNHT